MVITNRRTRWPLRLAAAALAIGLLTGPTPGNTGGCTATSSQADAHQFCEDRENWKCRREEFARRLDAGEAAACYSAVEPSCIGVNAWPSGCSPTTNQTEACILLLSREDFISFTNEELFAAFEDCNICP